MTDMQIHVGAPEKAGEEPPLPTRPEDLLAYLDRLGIAYALHRHPPIFTVADGAHLKKAIPGVHCRNLFLRDKKGAMFLVVAANETAIDLKKLPALLGCGRLSFGSPERLWSHLGIRPGSVCPYTILNDPEHRVALVLDAAMTRAQTVNYHPLDNAMTIGHSPGDLLKFVESTGRVPLVLDLGPAAPD